MEDRNLDFGIEMTAEQWAELGRAADALGAEEAGFAWDEGRFDEIRVLLREEDAPNLLRDWVGPEETYGGAELEVASSGSGQAVRRARDSGFREAAGRDRRRGAPCSRSRAVGSGNGKSSAKLGRISRGAPPQG